MDEVDTSVPLCRDCRHSFIPVDQWFFLPLMWLARLVEDNGSDQFAYRCRKVVKEQRTEFNPVSGSKLLKREHMLCSFARGKYEEECGFSGRLYVPKRKQDFLVWLKKVQ
jgi:hypothetical protein